MATTRGDFFSPQCDIEMDAAVRRGQDKVSDVVYDRVMKTLGASLRNPTGYYQNHVRDLVRGDVDVVTDQGVVYGPWLEGVSSRNGETRFKGYAAFRRATQSMQYRAAELVEAEVSRAVGEINS